MYRQTDILNSVREVPTGDKLETEQTISLVDHTQPAEEPGNHETDGERADSDVNLLTPITNEPRLIKLLTYNSLDAAAERETADCEAEVCTVRDRYGDEDDRTTKFSSALLPDDDQTGTPQLIDPATPRQTSYLKHGRAKANKLGERKHTGLGRGKEG
ncbi:hypothetical protein LTR53_007649 [Teratosphaeriaceae sp. CCFEE 6253]|nr:hypothetical protein LTR53_007649 [Teratosphaeriaceae sp. CCFEE 6253]